MADATCQPGHLMEDAIVALSPRQERKRNDYIHAIAPNPFDEGRMWEEARLNATREARARKLIWC